MFSCADIEVDAVEAIDPSAIDVVQHEVLSQPADRQNDGVRLVAITQAGSRRFGDWSGHARAAATRRWV